MMGENAPLKVSSGKKLSLLAGLVLVSSISIFLSDDYARLYSYIFRATVPVLVLFVGWLVFSGAKGELRNFSFLIIMSVLLNLIGETINNLTQRL